VKEGIMKGVGKYQFKGGAFKTSIKDLTPALKALNILLGSISTTADEKKSVRIARDNFVALRKQFPDPEKPALKDVESISSSFDELWAIFRDGAKRREPYIPPIFIQSRDDVDCAILETYVMNDDGSATVLVGGETWVPPDGLKEWIGANRKNIASRQKVL
jgi:hypothetical protein